MLDVVVADETEGATLGEHRYFIIYRAVAESEDDARGDPITVNDLRSVTRCDASASQRIQRKKAVLRALRVADRDWFCLQISTE